MINNYVSKFATKENTKKKNATSQYQGSNEESTKEEEFIFLEHCHENWQYYGCLTKKHQAKYDNGVQTKDSGKVQAYTNTPTNKSKEKEQVDN